MGHFSPNFNKTCATLRVVGVADVVEDRSGDRRGARETLGAAVDDASPPAPDTPDFPRTPKTAAAETPHDASRRCRRRTRGLRPRPHSDAARARPRRQRSRRQHHGIRWTLIRRPSRRITRISSDDRTTSAFRPACCRLKRGRRGRPAPAMPGRGFAVFAQEVARPLPTGLGRGAAGEGACTRPARQCRSGVETLERRARAARDQQPW